MSPHKARRRFTRGAVCWYLLGIAVVQLLLGLAVECAGPRLRDPVFSQDLERLVARRAEAPGRPLLLALGSSRTLMGLDAKRVNEIDNSWLTFNFGDLGAGPMLEQVFLRRILAAGIRPDTVLIEITPLQLATSIVVPSEENALETGRLTWSEMRRAAGYYRFPITAYSRWLKSRALAAVSRQRDLHDALGIDSSLTSDPAHLVADDFGFLRGHQLGSREAQVVSMRGGIERFAPRLANSHLAPGPAQAVRDLVDLCRQEHLPFAVVLMPEAAGFRPLHSTEFLAEMDRFIAELRGAGWFDLIDARTWVEDEGFWDPHHLHEGGARVFSERFAREVLPRLTASVPRELGQRSWLNGGLSETLAYNGR